MVSDHDALVCLICENLSTRVVDEVWFMADADIAFGLYWDKTECCGKTIPPKLEDVLDQGEADLFNKSMAKLDVKSEVQSEVKPGGEPVVEPEGKGKAKATPEMKADAMKIAYKASVSKTFLDSLNLSFKTSYFLVLIRIRLVLKRDSLVLKLGRCRREKRDLS